MPELPEVHTTATGLNKVLPGLTIKGVWTDYGGPFHKGKSHIKDSNFFKKFKGRVVGKKIISVSRRAKNVLINLTPEKSSTNKSGEKAYTILIHMKMTGHLLYGTYRKHRIKKDANKGDRKTKEEWVATEKGPLRDDPLNKWIHFVIELSNGKCVALSDMRKFAKVTLLETEKLHESSDLKDIGPEPIRHKANKNSGLKSSEKNFSFDDFKERILKKPNGKIKQILMDQTIIAGIGNIYSDEMLWAAGIHPLSKPAKIPEKILRKLYEDMHEVLTKGIDFGGDSMSDYRNIHGVRGNFQNEHNVYQLAKQPCRKRGCSGTIKKVKVGGRSGSFCPIHQKLFD